MLTLPVTVCTCLTRDRTLAPSPSRMPGHHVHSFGYSRAPVALRAVQQGLKDVASPSQVTGALVALVAFLAIASSQVRSLPHPHPFSVRAPLRSAMLQLVAANLCLGPPSRFRPSHRGPGGLLTAWRCALTILTHVLRRWRRPSLMWTSSTSRSTSSTWRRTSTPSPSQVRRLRSVEPTLYSALSCVTSLLCSLTGQSLRLPTCPRPCCTEQAR